MNQLGTFIQVMTEKEAVKEGMEISGGIRFCKVEKIQGSYVGSLYIPSRAKNRSHTGFYFRIEKDKIIFVDDSGKVLEWLKEMLKAGDEKQPELGIFFERMSRIALEGLAPFMPEGGVGMHVIPVEKAISTENQSLPIEHISHWLEKYEGKYAASPCSCRRSRKTFDEG